MANSTVYPFGPGGQLPSGISIVNDFTTGGADKAASAETVKVLYNTMNGLEREEEIELDVTGAARYNYMIPSSGKWSAGSSGEQCVLLNIVGVTKITVTMDGSNGSVALLKDANNMAAGNTPNYATGETGRRVINNGGSSSFVPPEDATLLYVTVKISSGDISANYEIIAKKIIDTGGFIERSDIVDNLNSDDATAPLSAKQGKVLKDLVDSKRGEALSGKKIAVIGDSISTIYGFDTPYWTVKDIDVGETIQSYVTWQDVYGNYVYPDKSHPTNKSIGGVTLTEAMIDGELHSFTPVAADVGKTIGVPRHYDGNTSSVKVWSKRLCDAVGATLLANASWSGSYITSMSETIYKASSHAWHPCTIGRCRVRDDNGNFINPDIIIVYRGTNDFSYGNNGNYPTLQISDVSLLNGFSATTDKISDGVFNFRTGYYLTIKALREAYPNALIVLCTLNVFKRVIYNKWPTRNDAFTLPDINNVIREIANVTGCPLIEFDKDGITFENCYPTYISDNATTPTHPNTNGHRVMAEKAIADLTYALNPTA